MREVQPPGRTKMSATATTDPANAESASSAPKKLRNVDRMGGFAKGLSVIEAFSAGRGTRTIAEIARISGLDRASARRCLLTLVECGYATQDGPYFQLTPRILKLSNAFLNAPLPELVQPYLVNLADTVRESCSVATLDGGEIVYILRAVHHGVMGAGLHPGSRLPAFCTGLGRVLLAALEPESARKILNKSKRRPLTKYTLTEVDDIMAELEKIRMNGYAIIDREIEIGARSIAIPILNVRGGTVAACTIGVHASSATCKQLKENYLPPLKEFQAQLSEILN